MARNDREGWKDDSAAASNWQGGQSGGGILGLGGGYREKRTTDVWEGAPGQQPYSEGKLTVVPELLKVLYGIFVVLTGPRRFDLLPVSQRTSVIGRENADIKLADASVSRRHAVLSVTGNDEGDAQVALADGDSDGVGSKTGTLVNGRFITKAVLRDRDRVKLGETELLFVNLWPFAR